MSNYKPLFKPKGKIVIVLMVYCDIMKETIKSHDSQRKWHPFFGWMIAAYNQNSEIRYFFSFGMKLWV